MMANGTPPARMRKEKAQAAIFRSIDSGSTWHQLAGGLPKSMERMVWDLSVDPNEPTISMPAPARRKGNVPRTQRRGARLTSRDRGDTWEQIYEGSNTVRSVSVGLS